MSYTAAVITVSDKGYRGQREDTSGPNLVRILQERGFDVTYTAMVPDEPEMIKTELCKCADELAIALVLTTGGTGFSPRDITPEATLEVVERQTPGIPEAMRAESMKITPKGCLSRSAAGIRGRTLIINLPGSKKASAVVVGRDVGGSHLIGHALVGLGGIVHPRAVRTEIVAVVDHHIGDDARAFGREGADHGTELSLGAKRRVLVEIVDRHVAHHIP